MHKLSLIVFVLLYFASPCAHAEDKGFVTIDPATLDTVSGKNLMITSYAVILGVLLLYTVSLLLRDRRLRHSIDTLKNQLQNK